MACLGYVRLVPSSVVSRRPWNNNSWLAQLLVTDKFYLCNSSKGKRTFALWICYLVCLVFFTLLLYQCVIILRFCIEGSLPNGSFHIGGSVMWDEQDPKTQWANISKLKNLSTTFIFQKKKKILSLENTVILFTRTPNEYCFNQNIEQASLT